MSAPKTLIVIPARGGSKGIPRKNLRILGGHPLIYYAIQNALNSKYNPTVVVSSEDEEILALATKFGAQTRRRPVQLAQDVTTLDPVIHDAFEHTNTGNFDLIVTLQPTTPLLKTSTLDDAIGRMIENPDVDTMLSATNDTHLTWRNENGKFLPNFTKRVNRQQLTPVYKETGSFLICRSSIISPTTRIGTNTDLYLVEGQEQIDVDTHEDWNLCEYYLRRKRILFVTTGYPEIGLGHIYRTMLLADELVEHDVVFLLDNKSALGKEKLERTHYPLHTQSQSNILDDIRLLQPDVIINDRLDTTVEYMKGAKEIANLVVNFEDIGSGAKMASLLINSMYPPEFGIDNEYTGMEYFCIRPEFEHTQPTTKTKENIQKVVLTFGGVDPNNYTARVAKIIAPFCRENQIQIHIVAGLGYTKYDSLSAIEGLHVHVDVKNISDLMQDADIMFTSAGRTTFEAASLGIPSIVLAQNERELKHEFVSEQNGFLMLGLGYERSDDEIESAFIHFATNQQERSANKKTMLSRNVRKSKQRVIRLIRNAISETVFE